jgi:hypothetical protein
VNVRSGCIEYTLLGGWQNKPSTGVVNPQETFLVEEVKQIAGDYVWVKLRRIDDQ